jgi:hypothetical protein
MTGKKAHRGFSPPLGGVRDNGGSVTGRLTGHGRHHRAFSASRRGLDRAFALVLIGSPIAGVQFSGENLAMAGAASASEKQYLMTHQQADPRFLTSIERVGAYNLATPPETGGIHVPWQICPKESVDKSLRSLQAVRLLYCLP